MDTKAIRLSFSPPGFLRAMLPIFVFGMLVFVLLLAPGKAEKDGAALTAGFAKVDITPHVPIRMVGYASRDYETPAGKEKLFARAMAIGNAEDELSALVISMDLLGVPRSLRKRVAERVENKLGLTPEKLALCATHTHGGPSLTDYMQETHFCEVIPDEQKAHIDEYTDRLVDQLEKVALEAAATRQAATLRWGEGRAGFAMNRRIVEKGNWTGMRPNPTGSVDHSVPVLTAVGTGKNGEENILGVFLSYACHCTSYAPPKNDFHGDWAGAAAASVENRHPGCVALVAAGCGADANPEPRIADAGPEVARRGERLADEVDALLGDPKRTILLTTPPTCDIRPVDLPLAEVPDREEFVDWTKGRDKRRAFYGQMWLDRLDRGEKVPSHFEYPIQIWRFPGENDSVVSTVFLPGEVTSGYSVRIKRELNTPARKHWVIGYANESPCYVTTAKEIGEGGYEVDASMVSYDKPSRLAPETEDIIVGAVAELSGNNGAQSAQEKIPPRPRHDSEPLSPDEALATFHTKAGLRVELVAAEPLVMDPVAFDWGPDGRLWVAEMRDYPNGLNWHGIDDPLNDPGGRIKVLTDTDGDGRYDQSEIFLDEIPYPTGVKVWNQGVLVTAAPEIFYAEDTDGDGKADKRETWYEGFARSNQQHRVNGLAWGLDNWLHVANGDGGGVILSKEARDEVDIRGFDLRFDPFSKQHERLSGRTQCGRYRDDWGNWFGCNNSNPLWHYPMQYCWLERNPMASPPVATVSVPVEPGAAPVYPLSETRERFNEPDRANRITSACGPNIYRDVALGSEYTGDVFVCEPVHNLVTRQVLRSKGSTFVSVRAPGEEQSEFLASTDSWFRPVSIKTGPDGALWVADMYRLVIEHPEWIPLEWQEKIDLRGGSVKGRIYRISAENRPPSAIRDLTGLDDVALVNELESSNGTHRDLVHQMLLWNKPGKEAVDRLEGMVKSGNAPTARLHALSVLSGLKELTPETARVAMSDGHPGIVENAARIAGNVLSAEVVAAAAREFIADASVACELAGALGRYPENAAAKALAGILLVHREDPYVTATALSSVNPANIGEVVRLLGLAYSDGQRFREEMSDVATVKAPPNALSRDLAAMAAKWKAGEATAIFANAVAERDAGEIASWQLSILVGLLGGGAGFEDLSEDERVVRTLKEIASQARTVATNPKKAEWERLEAIRLLQSPAVFDEETDLELIANRIGPAESPAVREAVFAALGKVVHRDTAALLLERWVGFGPSDQRAALNLLLRRNDWSTELLAALEEKRIALAQIDAASRQRLMDSQDDAVRETAKKLFGSATSGTRSQALKDAAGALKLTASAETGKTVFASACSACHRAEEVGNAIGPDLAALTDRTPESMLVAILDPNRAVEDKYMNYMISMKEGGQHLGLIADENAGAVILKAADGSEQTLARSEIDSMKSTGTSLMPEGLEAILTNQQIADVIAYVGTIGKAVDSAPIFARIRPDGKGVVTLPAAKCRISGNKLAYMPEHDALGWWTSAKDRAEWTVVLDRPGNYRVEWEYSVAPDAAGNPWQLVVNGVPALKGTVESSGSWETFKTSTLGDLELGAADNKIVLRSDGEIENALLDLRAIRLVPVEK